MKIFHRHHSVFYSRCLDQLRGIVCSVTSISDLYSIVASISLLGVWREVVSYRLFICYGWYSAIFRYIPWHSVLFRHIPWNYGVPGFHNGLIYTKFTVCTIIYNYVLYVFLPNCFFETFWSWNISPAWLKIVQIYALKYLIECFPYCTVWNRGLWKSEFRELYPLSADKKIILSGIILCFTLNIRIAMSCNRLLYKVERLGFISRFSYESVFVW